MRLAYAMGGTKLRQSLRNMSAGVRGLKVIKSKVRRSVRRAILCLMMIFMSSPLLYAGDIDIIRYIVENNPSVRMERELMDTSLLKKIQVMGKASAFLGTVGDTTDKGAVGITATIPLFDTKEKLARQKAVVDAEVSVTQEATEVLADLRIAQTDMRGLTAIIQAKRKYLEWIGKRVEVGVEYRKEYLEKQMELREREKETSKLQTQIEGYKIKLLSLVLPNARDKLLKTIGGDKHE